MITNILSDIICNTFERMVGRWQAKADEPKALLVKFKTRIDYDKEEGYRGVHLLIYGEQNYVGVFEKRWWRVIDRDKIEYDEEDGEETWPDEHWREGEGEWEMRSHHDSCWRTDGVSSFTFQNRDDLNLLDDLGQDHWFDIVPMTDELKAKLDEAYKVKRSR
jgi:hypothetical protein